MSELSVTHPNPLLLSSASSASHNIFTELQRTNYFQWWSCHFGAFAWKNILPWEEHTTSWHVFLLFWRGKNESDTLVLSFVLWYFYRIKTISFSCQTALKSKVTLQGGIVKMLIKLAVKEWTCVHTLLCMHLKWKVFCTEEFEKKAQDWSFCPWKSFKDINRQSIVWKTGKSSVCCTAVKCHNPYFNNQHLLLSAHLLLQLVNFRSFLFVNLVN